MYKFISSVIIITTLSLGYVAQQVRLLEYSYHINDNNKRLCLLIDQNNSLEYNIAHLKSPDSLKRRLASNNIKLDAPQNWQNIRLARTESLNSKTGPARNTTIKIAAKRFLDIFAPKTEAIAQEVNQP